MFPIFEKSQTVPSHDDDSSQPDVIETGGGGGGGGWAQKISQNSQSRLEGLIPVVEDWHAKGCFWE